MFTRNWWMYQAAIHAGNSALAAGSATEKPKYITWSGDIGADVYSGKEYTYRAGDSAANMASYPRFNYSDFGNKTVVTYNSLNRVWGGYGLLFGTDNTPPTVDDYKLAGDVITNCTYSMTRTSAIAEDGSEGTLTNVYTITNNNDAEITIGEIGLYSEQCWWTAYNTYTSYPVLFERTALETPITIPAGGVGQITYTIKMNYPVG